MNISDTFELLSKTRNFLIEDWEYVNRKKLSSDKELLKHVKMAYKEGELDEILEEVLLEYDFDNIEDDYKILLLVSACYFNAKNPSD
jgi:hypothetical protein